MPQIKLSEIVNFLRQSDFFVKLEIPYLEHLASQFEPMHVKGGQVVINEGERGDYLYLVVSGHLRVIRKSNGTEVINLNEIGRGELIGEIALLTDEVRTSSVVAIRDSILFRLSKDLFQQFLKQFPLQIFPIVKSALKSVIRPKSKKDYVTTIITLVPAGSHCPMFEKFADAFIREFSKTDSILLLNLHLLQVQLKKVGIDCNPECLDDSRITQWLNEQERNYKYIIYQTDFSYSDWTQMCLRQADKILLIACNEQDHALNEIERNLFNKSVLFRQSTDLALLHNNYMTIPNGTRKWLST